MNDAIALLAISQLVCLGALFYLYTQLQEVKKAAPARRKPSTRVHRMPGASDIAQGQHAAGRAAQAAYSGPVAKAAQPARAEVASLIARANGVVDVSALARRMRKSEEEVRILLRRQGIAS